MFPAGRRRDALIVFSVPALLIALGCSVSLLPAAAATALLRVLTGWTCLSVPLAILIGHCALGEE